MLLESNNFELTQLSTAELTMLWLMVKKRLTQLHSMPCQNTRRFDAELLQGTSTIHTVTHTLSVVLTSDLGTWLVSFFVSYRHRPIVLGLLDPGVSI